MTKPAHPSQPITSVCPGQLYVLRIRCPDTVGTKADLGGNVRALALAINTSTWFGEAHVVPKVDGSWTLELPEQKCLCSPIGGDVAI